MKWHTDKPEEASIQRNLIGIYNIYGIKEKAVHLSRKVDGVFEINTPKGNKKSDVLNKSFNMKKLIQKINEKILLECGYENDILLKKIIDF